MLSQVYSYIHQLPGILHQRIQEDTEVHLMMCYIFLLLHSRLQAPLLDRKFLKGKIMFKYV